MFYLIDTEAVLDLNGWYASKRVAKPKPVDKSVVMFEIKPWDDEADTVALAHAVCSIEMDVLVL